MWDNRDACKVEIEPGRRPYSLPTGTRPAQAGRRPGRLAPAFNFSLFRSVPGCRMLVLPFGPSPGSSDLSRGRRLCAPSSASRLPAHSHKERVRASADPARARFMPIDPSCSPVGASEMGIYRFAVCLNNAKNGGQDRWASASASRRLRTPSGPGEEQTRPRRADLRDLPPSTEHGSLTVAEATAKELPPLNLTDALDLTMLIGRKDPRRHPRAALRGPGLEGGEASA